MREIPAQRHKNTGFLKYLMDCFSLCSPDSMVAAGRPLHLLLAIMFQLLLQGHLTAGRDLFPDVEDYSQFEDIVNTVATTVKADSGGPLRRCDYDHCLEGQIPCAVLAASKNCLCPGFTQPNEIPDMPSIRSVTWNGTDVVAKWCAPYSDVTTYILTVGGQERRRFGEDRRSGGAGYIDNVSTVCVVAANNVGGSKPSCMMYKPRESSLPLKAGLIGGALGLLLLLLLAILLWRHKRQRKQELSNSRLDTA